MFPRQSSPSDQGGIPKYAVRLLTVAGAFVLLTIIAIVGLHMLRPSSSARGMSGTFLHAAAVPGPAGDYRLWILTDGSFLHYIKSVRTPGRISMEAKCLFCKTWLYIYAPRSKSVLAKFKTDYKSLILHTWMAAVDGKVWVASGSYHQNEPGIFVYETEPPGLIAQTSDIVARHPELASGIVDLRMAKDPDRLVLETRDGRKGVVLTLRDEKLYQDEAEFRKSLTQDEESPVTVFALAQDRDGGPRKKLYRVTGPKGKVTNSSVELFLREPQMFMMSAKATAEPAAAGRAFIEGLIVEQDEDGCVILHQDAAGRKANRLLTRVTAARIEKWTTRPEDLFPETKVDLDKRSFSGIFFMKDKLSVSRIGNLVMLELSGVGLIGFDVETGRKLWELKF
jgi:hypothetical protein